MSSGPGHETERTNWGSTQDSEQLRYANTDEARGEGNIISPRDGGIHDNDTPVEQPYGVPERLAGTPPPVNIETTVAEGEGRKTFYKRLGAGVLVAGVAGIAFGLLSSRDTNNNENENLPPQPKPTTAGPLVPGRPSASTIETSTASPEVITEKTVVFRSGTETTVGIEQFYEKTGLFKFNDPKAPAPTEKEGLDLWEAYLNTLKTVVNVETDPEGEKFKEEISQKILFTEANAGALSALVSELQAEGIKIVSIDGAGLIGKPDKQYPAQGEGILSIKHPDGTIEKIRITAALVNNGGLINNIGEVSTVYRQHGQ